MKSSAVHKERGFFGELSGPEGVQVMKYAARAIQLAREVDGTNLEPQLHAALATLHAPVDEVVR